MRRSSKPSPECLQDCGGLQGTGGDSRGLGGATDSAENRALATEVARHRSFRLDMDAGSIPAASTNCGLSQPGQISTIPGHETAQVGQDVGLGATCAEQARSGRDAAGRCPACGGAQQEHNGSGAGPTDSPAELAELVTNWEGLPGAIRSAILILARSVPSYSELKT